MSAPAHRLILASAGTGKTWQLTGRFLAILFAGVPPERILATTFTRKAAGEILDRVLRRLARAAVDAKGLEELEEAVGRPLSHAEVRERLVELCGRLDRFRVRTLDAFFLQLAKLFALEVGLPADWSIADEAADRALRREALADALEETGSDELVALLRDLQQSDASRSVERVLLEKVDEGRTAWLDSDAEAWDRIRVREGLDDEELARVLAELGGLDLPRTKGGAPRANWRKARTALLELARAGDWAALQENTLVQRAVEGGEYDRVPVPPEWAATLERLRAQAAHALLFEIVRQNRAAHRWLGRFEEAYDGRKRSERAFRFDDLPKALHPRDESRITDQDLVWYRLDGRVDHLLLDEFQDTAPVQWRLLSNLADEILADGTGERSFFCVGDVKQSIYGWREAEPRLLEEMGARYGLEATSLTRSWRSSRVVLDTVTRVFSGIASNPVFADRPERIRAAEAFAASFEDHQAAKELPGAAWLVEAPEHQEGEDEDAPVLRLAADRTRAILDEAPGATLGLLLRRNEDISELIHLLRERGIRASGEGGNQLVDSAAVLHAVSLLHLADHPSDTMAAFHVALSPLGAAVELGPEGFRDAAPRASALVRERLAAEGYGSFLASLAPLVAGAYGAWDVKRFDQLVDLGYAFEDRSGLRADAFVDHVRATPVEDPSATQVKVMTVHAAKGLEFDAVVLPELDAALTPRETKIISRRSEPAGLLDAVSHSRSREVCRLDPQGLWPLYQDHKARETREALCLLYVALTRARFRVDMLVRHRSDPTRVRKTFAGLLAAALAPGAPPGEGGVVWAHPDNAEPWHPAPAAEERPTPAEPAVPPESVLRAGAPRSPLRRTPSAQEGSGLLDVRDLLRAPDAAARVRGTLVHRWFEEVEWLEDFDATDDELRALARPITRDAKLVDETLSAFRSWLGRPTTRAVLGRPPTAAEGTEHVVWRERPFSLVLAGEDGGEELWSGAFDRVVLERRGGAVLGAELVDYKTDRVEPGDLDERAAHYAPQLDGYRRVLARMCALDPGAVTARLFFVEADALR